MFIFLKRARSSSDHRPIVGLRRPGEWRRFFFFLFRPARESGRDRHNHPCSLPHRRPAAQSSCSLLSSPRRSVGSFIRFVIPRRHSNGGLRFHFRVVRPGPAAGQELCVFAVLLRFLSGGWQCCIVRAATRTKRGPHDLINYQPSSFGHAAMGRSKRKHECRA